LREPIVGDKLRLLAAKILKAIESNPATLSGFIRGVNREIVAARSAKSLLDEIDPDKIWTVSEDYVEGVHAASKFYIPIIKELLKQRESNPDVNTNKKYRKPINPRALKGLMQRHTHRNGDPNWTAIGNELHMDADTVKQQAIDCSLFKPTKRPRKTANRN